MAECCMSQDLLSQKRGRTNARNAILGSQKSVGVCTVFATPIPSAIKMPAQHRFSPTKTLDGRAAYYKSALAFSNAATFGPRMKRPPGQDVRGSPRELNRPRAILFRQDLEADTCLAK